VTITSVDITTVAVMAGSPCTDGQQDDQQPARGGEREDVARVLLSVRHPHVQLLIVCLDVLVPDAYMPGPHGQRDPHQPIVLGTTTDRDGMYLDHLIFLWAQDGCPVDPYLGGPDDALLDGVAQSLERHPLDDLDVGRCCPVGPADGVAHIRHRRSGGSVQDATTRKARSTRGGVLDRPYAARWASQVGQ
jgi:hypothetical protein